MSGARFVRATGTLLAALPLVWLARPCAAQCNLAWQAIGGVGSGVACVAEWDPDGAGPLSPRIVIGGQFANAGGAAAANIAVWDPATGAWSTLGAGFNYSVDALLAMPNGDLIAGGSFTVSGGTPMLRVARWNGGSWQPLGTGINGDVLDLVRTPAGDVVASGLFTAAGGVAAAHIARWNGTNWSAMGAGIPYPGARNMMVRANGDVLVAQHTAIVRWTGSTWAYFGTTGAPGNATALCELPNGDILAADGAGVLRSNGGAWTALTPAFQNGLYWGAVSQLVALPDGDFVVAGAFDSCGGQPLANIARWDGAALQPLGVGVGAGVAGAAFTSHGELWVVGWFGTAGGLSSPGFARLASTCPATVVDLGGGCASTGGSNTLSAASRPWVDGTLRVVGTGLPSPALVIAATGLTPVVPGLALDSVFVEAPAGCLLHVLPLIEQVLVSTTGTVESALFLPNTPPLVGVTFYQQMFPFELGPGLSVLQITATNALQMTAGDF